MITMTRAHWLSILAPAARAASRKPVRPTDACVLVATDGKRIVARAGDGYTFAAASRSCDAKAARFIVDAQAFVERVKTMRDGDVAVVVHESSVEVRGGSRKFTLPTASADEFVDAPKVNGERFEAYERALFTEAIATVRHAISTDDTRPHVASVLVELSGLGVRAVATDGHRLAVARVGTTDANPTRFLVPRNAAALLVGVEGERVDLEASATLLAVTSRGEVDVTYTVTLIDASFPPWEQVIPKARECKAQVSSPALSQSVQAVALAAGERSGGVVLRFEDDRVVLSSESPDRGNAGDEVEADGRTGTGVPMGVNARYLVDALAACGDLAAISAAGETEPLTVESLDGSTVCVVMPMRVT